MRWIPLREKGAKRSPKGAPAKKKPAPKKKPALKKISSPDVTPKAKAGKRKNAMPDEEEQEDQTKKPKEEPQPKEACNSDPKPSKKGDKTYNKTAKQEERRKLWMQFHRTKKPPKPGDRSQKCLPDALDQNIGGQIPDRQVLRLVDRPCQGLGQSHALRTKDASLQGRGAR